MESLNQLRQKIEMHQKDTDDLKSDLKKCFSQFDSNKLDDVGKMLENFYDEARKTLDDQWQQLQNYLQDNFSKAHATAPPLDTIGGAYDLLENQVQDGDPGIVGSILTLVGVGSAWRLNGKEMKYYFVEVPDVWLLRSLDGPLNNRRDQQNVKEILNANLKVLAKLIEVDPKGVAELIREVGKILSDKLGDSIVSASEFFDYVVCIVAKILEKILEWTREAGGDIVQWIKDNADQVEKFVAALADFVRELSPDITSFIGQPGAVVAVMGAVVAVVLIIRTKSRIRLEELEISESD